jgi:hypothetical protein
MVGHARYCRARDLDAGKIGTGCICIAKTSQRTRWSSDGKDAISLIVLQSAAQAAQVCRRMHPPGQLLRKQSTAPKLDGTLVDTDLGADNSRPALRQQVVI